MQEQEYKQIDEELIASRNAWKSFSMRS